MTNHLISIIVPAYNIASYIEKTLASILAQTYRNIEVIIVDDGSRDATGAILDEMAKTDPRIRVIHKENGGVTSARLRGVAEATGEWIGFVDGDDYIEPQMFAHLLNNALKYQADISHCGYQMVFPKGHVDYYYNTGRLEQQDGLEGLKNLLDGSYIEPGLWNKLYHRSLFQNLLRDDLMDLTIRNTEDLLMNYYLFREAQKSVYEDVCPYHYLLRASSAATSGYTENKLRDPIKVLRILQDEMKDEPSVNAVVRRRYIRAVIGNATLDCWNQSEMVRSFRKEMRGELRGMLGQVLRDGGVSAKLKLMALWAGILPDIYCWVHEAYAKLKGTDKIYSLDK